MGGIVILWVNNHGSQNNWTCPAFLSNEIKMINICTPPFRSLWSLRNVFVFERKAQCRQYSVDIVNVVNDYCSWKWMILNGIST
jgi:hypothetical protein